MEMIELLSQVKADRSRAYKEAYWQTSPFESNVWHCQFGKRSFDIRFDVQLDDGSILTDWRHTPLLTIFKCWLCVQTHYDATGGRPIDSAAALRRVRRTLAMIDYFLLNAEALSLADLGAHCMTESFMSALLVKIGKSSRLSDSVYGWHERLSNYLKLEISNLQEFEITDALSIEPTLGDMGKSGDHSLLDLCEYDLLRARVYLWSRGFYRYPKGDYRFYPSTVALSKEIYPNTLAGNMMKQAPPELCVPHDSYAREFEAVPTRTNTERSLSRREMGAYKSVLRRLGLLVELDLPVPQHALHVLDDKSVDSAISLKDTGRFRTLPNNVVLFALRNALEFVIEYGDDLVNSYLALLRESHRLGKTCQSYSEVNCLAHLMTPKIRQLGVQQWRLRSDRLRLCSARGRRPDEVADYFTNLRKNRGLWELLVVLYGAVQVCVGTFAARRQSELTSLTLGRALSRSGTGLVFKNKKSGVIGLLEQEVRPIPLIAVRAIKIIERLQEGVSELRLTQGQEGLFSTPSKTGSSLCNAGPCGFSQAFDYFCDYFKVPGDRCGRRFYIRQHQLRRFFAQAFFWSNTFGGMDTLRWFLGHTDIEHLYHYITESTPGDVLRSVKVSYAVERVKEHALEADDLSEVLQRHFGTSDFSVLDSQELEEYVEELLIEGKVSVEPHFFEDVRGKSHQVFIVVNEC